MHYGKFVLVFVVFVVDHAHLIAMELPLQISRRLSASRAAHIHDRFVATGFEIKRELE